MTTRQGAHRALRQVLAAAVTHRHLPRDAKDQDRDLLDVYDDDAASSRWHDVGDRTS